MERLNGAFVLAGCLLWPALEACGGESFNSGDDAENRSNATAGTAGRGGGSGGTSAAGAGGAAGTAGTEASGGAGGTGGTGTAGGPGAGGTGTAGGAGTGGTKTAGGAGERGTGGGFSSCEEVREALDEELAALRSCTENDECGQVLTGTSCGCTRNLVARLDADTTRFGELLTTQVNGETCSEFGSPCDCPPADGFECRDRQCGWHYVDPSSCEAAPLGSLCVLAGDDGTLKVGDPLRIEVSPSGCYSSSCTETLVAECQVDESGGNYLASATICLLTNNSSVCTDDCGGGGSARCESTTTLTEGVHRVTLDNLSVEFEVPSNISGASCFVVVDG